MLVEQECRAQGIPYHKDKPAPQSADQRRDAAAETYANKLVAKPRQELEPWQEEIASHFKAGWDARGKEAADENSPLGWQIKCERLERELAEERRSHQLQYDERVREIDRLTKENVELREQHKGCTQLAITCDELRAKLEELEKINGRR